MGWMRARTLLLVGGLALTTVPAERARAEGDDAASACADAAEEGQRRRIAGQLHAARATFDGCLRPECPALVQKDCAQFVLEVETAMPSVVVAARDGAGADLTAVRVLVDGAVFLERLNGQAQAIDPGVHRFHFETSGAPPLDQTIVVHEGEKSRVIAVTLQAPLPPPIATVIDTRVPIATWIALGVGTIALGSFSYFGLSARHDFNRLRSTCGGDCPQADVDRVRTKAIVADVSLSVSLVSFGVAAWTFFARGTTPSSVKSGTVHVDGAISASGGRVSISGAF